MNKKEYTKTLVCSIIVMILGVFSTICIGYMTIELASVFLILFPIAIIIAVVGYSLLLLLGIAPVFFGLISAILSIIALKSKETSISENTRNKLNKTARMFLIILLSIYLGIFVSYLLISIL